MGRIAITLGIVLGTLAMGFILFVYFTPHLSTEYGMRFNKEHFSLIRTNITVEEVYRLVGPPLFSQVNPDVSGTGAYRQTRDYDVGLDHLRSLVLRTNTEVYLEFSAPKHAGRDYFRYSVDFLHGVVRSYAGPVRMD